MLAREKKYCERIWDSIPKLASFESTTERIGSCYNGAPSDESILSISQYEKIERTFKRLNKEKERIAHLKLLVREKPVSSVDGHSVKDKVAHFKTKKYQLLKDESDVILNSCSDYRLWKDRICNLIKPDNLPHVSIAGSISFPEELQDATETCPMSRFRSKSLARGKTRFRSCEELLDDRAAVRRLCFSYDLVIKECSYLMDHCVFLEPEYMVTFLHCPVEMPSTSTRTDRRRRRSPRRRKRSPKKQRREPRPRRKRSKPPIKKTKCIKTQKDGLLGCFMSFFSLFNPKKSGAQMCLTEVEEEESKNIRYEAPEVKVDENLPSVSKTIPSDLKDQPQEKIEPPLDENTKESQEQGMSRSSPKKHRESKSRKETKTRIKHVKTKAVRSSSLKKFSTRSKRKSRKLKSSKGSPNLMVESSNTKLKEVIDFLNDVKQLKEQRRKCEETMEEKVDSNVKEIRDLRRCITLLRKDLSTAASKWQNIEALQRAECSDSEIVIDLSKRPSANGSGDGLPCTSATQTFFPVQTQEEKLREDKEAQTTPALMHTASNTTVREVTSDESCMSLKRHREAEVLELNELKNIMISSILNHENLEKKLQRMRDDMKLAINCVAGLDKLPAGAIMAGHPCIQDFPVDSGAYSKIKSDVEIIKEQVNFLRSQWEECLQKWNMDKDSTDCSTAFEENGYKQNGYWGNQKIKKKDSRSGIPIMKARLQTK